MGFKLGKKAGPKMQETKGQTERAIKGIDQQDYDEFQLISGSFPHQIGLQKRFPGKTIQRVLDGPIGSIYVFYMVYGRTYTIVDFGTLQIDEVVEPPYVPPPLPPVGSDWIDDFSGYPENLLSKFWGAGAWSYTVGVCESIIEGGIDPFLISPGFADPGNGNNLPRPGDSGAGQGVGAPGPGDPRIIYPINPPDIWLVYRTAQADYSCTGGGTNSANVSDYIEVFTGSTVVDIININSVAIGGIIESNTIRIGRIANIDYGVVRNNNPIGSPLQCGGPPQPVPLAYYINTINQSFGLQS